MTRSNSQPVSAISAGRQQQQQRLQVSTAYIKAQLVVGAAATSAQAQQHWKQLLAEEAELQGLEAVMTVQNLRWSSVAWAQLHDRSEQLSHDLAACLQQLRGRRDV